MNDRIGEVLWSEWDGLLFESHSEDSVIYYTNDHVDMDNEVVKRGLASALQRDGIADSLRDAFNMLEKADVIYGYSGYDEDEIACTVCDEFGETFYGDVVKDPKETTFIEI